MKNNQDLTVAAAQQMVLAAVSVLGNETVQLSNALERVLAHDVTACDNLPPFDNSAMDGYALVADDVATASRETPITLRVVADVAAGSWPSFTLQRGEAARIMTGAPVPQGATAVIPVEDTSEKWKDRERPLPAEITMYRGVNAGDYVRPTGDDVQSGQIVLRAGQLVRPQEIGLLASLGVAQVAVVNRPKVGILSTGDELVEVDQPLGKGQIRNSNLYTQMAQVTQAGGIPVPLGTAKDTIADVRTKLQTGLDQAVDLFVSSAGVSVGAYDVVKQVLDDGGEVGFWRVKMRPGKPLAFGTYAGVTYFGLPGNPVSAQLSFETFVRPALLKMAGRSGVFRPKHRATLTQSVTSDGRESYLRAKITQDEQGNYTAEPLSMQGSHQITGLIQANGLVIVPLGVQTVPAGTQLDAILL